MFFFIFFFFKQKTAYELRISDWSSDVCSSDLLSRRVRFVRAPARRADGATGGGKGQSGRPARQVAGLYRAQFGPRLDRQTGAVARQGARQAATDRRAGRDRKSTRLNSSH